MKVFVYQQLQICPPCLHRRTLLATRSLCAAGSSLWTVGLRSVRLCDFTNAALVCDFRWLQLFSKLPASSGQKTKEVVYGYCKFHIATPLDECSPLCNVINISLGSLWNLRYSLDSAQPKISDQWFPELNRTRSLSFTKICSPLF